jgi:hypothetical protein
MTKLLSALKRGLGGPPQAEPAPHFHQGTSDSFPEVCFVHACDRPQLTAR